MKRQLIAISGVTLVAQLAGYAKLWLMARLFGVGPELDGYYLGFVLPSLIAGIISGILQVSFLPVHAEIQVKHDRESVRRFERLILLAVAALCGTATLFIFLGADYFVAMVAGVSSASVHEAVRYVLPIAALAIFLNGINDYLGLLLALNNRYAVASAAPIANSVLGAMMLAAWPEGGLVNLTLGTILGTVVQVAICLVTAMRFGFQPFGQLPNVTERWSASREMSAIAGWTVPGVIFSNIMVSLPPLLITAYGDGAVAAFGYAQRLYAAVYLLLAAGAPFILAQFAILAAQGETPIVRRLLRKAAWISGAAGIAVTVLVWVFGTQIVGLMLASGRFDAAATLRTAQHWNWLTLGLGFSVWGIVLAKYLQADRRPAVLSAHAGMVLLVFWSSSVVLAYLQEFSIAAAVSLAAAVSALSLYGLAQLGLSGAATKYKLGKLYR